LSKTESEVGVSEVVVSEVVVSVDGWVTSRISQWKTGVGNGNWGSVSYGNWGSNMVDGWGTVRDGDWRNNILDDWGVGSISVAFSDRVGEVSS